ncbi:MAG: tetratricopeptide repeat protein [Deltaproteobacteria bacterium]|nr:tetratricopeptide repeat protein [Deltaproteobacteria bacterium]
MPERRAVRAHAVRPPRAGSRGAIACFDKLGTSGVSALLALVGSVAAASTARAQDAGRGPRLAVDAGTVTIGDAGAMAPPPGGEVPLPEFLRPGTRRTVERPPPGADQVEALRQMEQELERWTRSAQSYRDTVVALVRREYQRQRRERLVGYDRQIRAEERLEDRARLDAIRLFERFLQRYPDDPRYTPDAMFRLAELYFEAASIEYGRQYDLYQEEVNRRQAANQSTEDLQQPRKDFTRTIQVYRRLIEQFPTYRLIDGAYYLLGYCLSEMERYEEARMAWLNLVCSNNFRYDAAAFAAQQAAEAADAGVGPTAEEQHPSLALVRDAGPDMPFSDPYTSCTPVVANTRFLGETWLRLGEYHFDYDFSPQGLDLAISAYQRVVAMPEDRNYSLALYKLAWAYYRSDRYREAIRHFAMLVDWSDEQQRRTGQAGADLRLEAIQYLGIAMAEPDWDGDGQPDGVTGIQRIRDPALMPQDREWTREVYVQLGQVYYDQAMFPQAIEVWREVLRRWPFAPEAPRITELIARAHQRLDQMDEALTARSELGRFAEGGEWYARNTDHPEAQRQAQRLAENALINTALQHHRAAQNLRRLAVENQDPEMLAQAQREYTVAADAYRRYLRAYQNRPEAYEIQFSLADALYWSQRYEEAYTEYAAVRDSNLDDSHLAEAARMAVESQQRLIDQATRAGTLRIPAQPPTPSGDPPTVAQQQIPELVQRLMQAREAYVERVDPRRDRENLRGPYSFNNAMLLYLYGYWPQSRQRLQQTYVDECMRSDAGREAFLALRNMAVSLQQTDEVERLARDYRQRRCSFTRGQGPAEEVTDEFCAQSQNREDPRCVVGGDLRGIQYTRAMTTFREAEGAEGDRQRQLYEQSARLLLDAVAAAPRAREAPLALQNAAVALERVQRFESAARIYRRIIDEVGPRRTDDAEEQQRLDEILANAYFRLAFNSSRFFDYEAALENYRTLADSERLGRSTSDTVRSQREDALVNAARLLEDLQQYARAADYYRRAAEVIRDRNDQISARYRVAEMAFKRRDWNGTIREMRAFITNHQGVREAGELVVQAHWRIAEAQRSLGRDRDYQAALAETVSAFARSGQAAGSNAAEYAAHAQFLIVDQQSQQFESFSIRPTGRTMQEIAGSLKQQVSAGAQKVGELERRYAQVASYRRPVWTVASHARTGRAYELLARAIVAIPPVLGRDIQTQLGRLPEDQREELRLQLEDQWRQLLDQQARPVECRALKEYALAVRAAREGNISNEYTQSASERLAAYGEERLVECLSAPDTPGGPYRPGEFARSPVGMSRPPARAVGSPPLAPPE